MTRIMDIYVHVTFTPIQTVVAIRKMMHGQGSTNRSFRTYGLGVEIECMCTHLACVSVRPPLLWGQPSISYTLRPRSTDGNLMDRPAERPAIRARAELQAPSPCMKVSCMMKPSRYRSMRHATCTRIDLRPCTHSSLTGSSRESLHQKC
jgi:hypothetical protein